MVWILQLAKLPKLKFETKKKKDSWKRISFGLLPATCEHMRLGIIQSVKCLLCTGCPGSRTNVICIKICIHAQCAQAHLEQSSPSRHSLLRSCRCHWTVQILIIIPNTLGQCAAYITIRLCAKKFPADKPSKHEKKSNKETANKSHVFVCDSTRTNEQQNGKLKKESKKRNGTEIPAHLVFQLNWRIFA